MRAYRTIKEERERSKDWLRKFDERGYLSREHVSCSETCMLHISCIWDIYIYIWCMYHVSDACMIHTSCIWDIYVYIWCMYHVSDACMIHTSCILDVYIYIWCMYHVYEACIMYLMHASCITEHILRRQRSSIQRTVTLGGKHHWTTNLQFNKLGISCFTTS